MRRKDTRENAGCLTYCVARYFSLDPRRVPFFIGHEDWRKRLAAFFYRRGFIITPVPFSKRLLTNKRKLYIVQGLSQRSSARRTPTQRFGTLHHAILYRGRYPYYFPYGSGIKGKPYWLWSVTKRRTTVLKKSKKRR